MNFVSDYLEGQVRDADEYLHDIPGMLTGPSFDLVAAIRNRNGDHWVFTRDRLRATERFTRFIYGYQAGSHEGSNCIVAIVNAEAIELEIRVRRAWVSRPAAVAPARPPVQPVATRTDAGSPSPRRRSNAQIRRPTLRSQSDAGVATARDVDAGAPTESAAADQVDEQAASEDEVTVTAE